MTPKRHPLVLLAAAAGTAAALLAADPIAAAEPVSSQCAGMGGNSVVSGTSVASGNSVFNPDLDTCTGRETPGDTEIVDDVNVGQTGADILQKDFCGNGVVTIAGPAIESGSLAQQCTPAEQEVTPPE